MNVDNLFKMMYRVSGHGVYSLVNSKDKRVYISYSKDICTSLTLLLKNIKLGGVTYKQLKKDLRKLKFCHLEYINKYDSYTDVQMKMQYFVDLYKQSGYELYSSGYKHQSFRVRLNIDHHINNFVVELVTRNSRKSFVVGVFDNVHDAEDFMTIFDGMDRIVPVYAINRLTREYFSK